MKGRQLYGNAIKLSAWLNETYATTVEWQKGIIAAYDKIVMAPLASAKTGLLPKGESFERLQACAKLVEAELAKVCGRQDVDVWLTYVRRLPALIKGWEEDWVVCATLAIMKYAKWSEPTSGGTTAFSGMAAVRIPSTLDIAEDVVRIALLSRHMGLLTSTCRWIGKGARIEHRGNGDFKRVISDELDKAVMSYEDRRPDPPPWHEIGIVPVEVPHDGVSYVFSGLRLLRSDVVIRKLDLPTPMAYVPQMRPAAELADILDPYKKAIEAQYGLSLAAVMHPLVAMTRLIAGRFPEPVDETRYAFDQDPDDLEFAKGLTVFLNVVQRGLVSMPEEPLRKMLSSEPCPPWSNNAAEAAAAIDAFFKVFSLDPKRRDEINVVLRLPFYQFLFTSPSGICYIDLLAISEFYRELVLEARDWAGKVHGDNFTMDVRRLAKRIPGVKALPKISGLKYESGQNGEIDVPLLVGNRLYAVECKAYSKSAAFMSGDTEAINTRTQQIKGWVEQAKKAAETLAAQRTTVDPKVPDEVNEIVWVVCTSGQEFVCPVDKFGTFGTLPRVCIVAEFLEHLRAEAAKVAGK